MARACNEPRLVERRFSFAVKVTTASGNWKHPLPLKKFFSVMLIYPCHALPIIIADLSAHPKL